MLCFKGMGLCGNVSSSLLRHCVILSQSARQMQGGLRKKNVCQIHWNLGLESDAERKHHRRKSTRKMRADLTKKNKEQVSGWSAMIPPIKLALRLSQTPARIIPV